MAVSRHFTTETEFCMTIFGHMLLRAGTGRWKRHGAAKEDVRVPDAS